MLLDLTNMNENSFKLHELCKVDLQVRVKDGASYISFRGEETINCQSLEKLNAFLIQNLKTCKTKPSMDNFQTALVSSIYVQDLDESPSHDSENNTIPKIGRTSKAVVTEESCASSRDEHNSNSSSVACNDNANDDGSPDKQGSPPHDSENHNIVTKGVVTKDVDSGNSATSKSETGETILAESVNHHVVNKGIPEGIDSDNSHIEERGKPHESSGNEEDSASLLTESSAEESNLDSSSSISVSDSELCSSDSPQIETGTNGSDESSEDEESGTSSQNESDGTDVISEGYPFERFKDRVVRISKRLDKHYTDKQSELKEKCEAVVIYLTDKGQFKELRCKSRTEAKREAFNSSDIRKSKFPVVLIKTTDKSSAFRESRKQVKANSSKVGQIKSPTICGTLHTASGQKQGEFCDIEFQIDTGADTGSVGYNCKIVKDSILTVCVINGNLEPGILGKVTSDVITGDEILVLDVDEDPNWNAIGLETLRNYPIFMDIKNGKVLMGKHEDVTINTQEKTTVVKFKNENCYHEYQL
jgi:hypothetical protein